MGKNTDKSECVESKKTKNEKNINSMDSGLDKMSHIIEHETQIDETTVPKDENSNSNQNERNNAKDGREFSHVSSSFFETLNNNVRKLHEQLQVSQQSVQIIYERANHIKQKLNEKKEKQRNEKMRQNKVNDQEFEYESENAMKKLQEEKIILQQQVKILETKLFEREEQILKDEQEMNELKKRIIDLEDNLLKKKEESLNLDLKNQIQHKDLMMKEQWEEKMQQQQQIVIQNKNTEIEKLEHKIYDLEKQILQLNHDFSKKNPIMSNQKMREDSDKGSQLVQDVLLQKEQNVILKQTIKEYETALRILAIKGNQKLQDMRDIMERKEKYFENIIRKGEENVKELEMENEKLRKQLNLGIQAMRLSIETREREWKEQDTFLATMKKENDILRRMVLTMKPSTTV